MMRMAIGYGLSAPRVAAAGRSVALSVVLLAMAGHVEAQSVERFDGIHVGAGLASQNVWGGSFVDGVDVLSQDRRSVFEVTAGWRKQFDWFVGGVELHYGFFDGSLFHADADRQLTVTYQGNRQFGYGLSVGGVIGSGYPTLLFAYASEMTRKFDVVVQDPSRTFGQNDEQGFLRYGVGVEVQLLRRIGLRGTVGSYRVDFGDLVTNIDVGSQVEYTLGVSVQLGG